MRRIVEKVCIAYAGIAFMASVVWCFVILLTKAPNDVPRFLFPATVLHFIFLFPTFDKSYHPEPRWLPVFSVTPKRAAWARGVTIGGGVVFGIALVVLAVTARRQHTEEYLQKCALLIIALLGAWSALYMIAHWALRPENFLGRKFVSLMGDGLARIFMRRHD